ncbi:hypothetical protein KKE60_04340 [Patescibacteria group bacterium]|nr:hypothetical protein [Patescibacteria group bacterium]
MEDKTALGIVGIIALGIVACFLAYLHSSRQPVITPTDIQRAREIVRSLD